MTPVQKKAYIIGNVFISLVCGSVFGAALGIAVDSLSFGLGTGLFGAVCAGLILFSEGH